jgi:alkylated DNA repair dioxygenase AlkB
MDLAQRDEAHIVRDHNVLVVLSALPDESVLEDFCGSVVTARDLDAQRPRFSGKTVYLCGDISGVLSGARDLEPELRAAARVFVVADHADPSLPWQTVPAGRVPVLVHGVGVLYRRFFDLGIDYFDRIRSEHTFQILTESTKPGQAHRTGIYLTPVERIGQELHFRLLRCSTNLSGPTENFRATDRHIVEALNQEAATIFQGQAPLNHVLAQIYHNTAATDVQKQTKAKIKAHADKTKDMPKNAIMAFCTFYDRHDVREEGLTRLIFRLKPQVAERPGCTLPAQFTVTLSPSSVFFVPMSTNRWYTHEIRPSSLDAAQAPTRLGYVVRCSATEAVHEDGHTLIHAQGALRRLQPPTPEGMAELRRLYAEENRTDTPIDYADRFLFSMNEGDYLAPAYDMADEFRQYPLPTTADPFEELSASVRFQDVGRGRQGAVLVRPDPARGTPIVRTTTSYALPAQPVCAAHLRLAGQIQSAASLPLELNNALVERYTDAYTTMGLHSDQAQDLEEGSYIALFSCYKHPERVTTPRLLVVESKEPDGGTFTIPLAHGSVVVFSLDTNRRFRHKIVLESSREAPENEWLGVTFRTSRTFVRYRDGRAYLEDSTPLVLADDEERQELYRLRGRENREPGFAYPPMSSTLSPSDLVPPEPGQAP